MSDLIAIDPAVRVEECAWARYDDGVLEFGGFDPSSTGGFNLSRHTAVVCEFPQLDERTRAVGAKTSLQMAAAAGYCVGHLEARGVWLARYYTPTEWKGSEPKPQNHARLWAVLSGAERAVLGGDKTERAIDLALEKGALCRWSKRGADYYPRSFKTHNLLDAAALGAVHLGRLERR